MKTLLARMRSFWRGLRKSERLSAEMEEEMCFHIEMEAERLVRERGLEPEEARRRAAGAFGGVERYKEEGRESRGLRLINEIRGNVRYAMRSLRGAPGFTLPAVLTLALGVGATTAIFSVLSGLVLRPLPFVHPDRLVQLYGTTALYPERDAVANLPGYRAQSTSFDALVGYWVTARYLLRPDGAGRVRVVTAERGFFPMLGVKPLLGRTFGADDPADVAVVSEAFWRRELDGDRSAIGRSVTLDGKPFTVLGVMPASFQFPYSAASLLPGVAAEARTELWIPVDPPLGEQSRVSGVTGRLKPGVTLEAAQSEIGVISARLAAAHPEAETRRGVYLEPLPKAVVSPLIRRLLFLLFGAVGMVLTLACANVANLFLVRMSLRRRELAVRTALGAGRARLVRQLLTETLLLALTAGGLGLGLAWAGTRQLTRIAAAHLPRAHEVGLDWRVFLFLFLACTLAGVVVGLIPALLTSGQSPQSALGGAAGGIGMGRSERRVCDALVVTEIALSFLLAVGAAVLIREQLRLRHTDPGMTSRDVVTVHIGKRGTMGSEGRRYQEIVERVGQLPGVRAAGLTQLLPLQNWGWTANSSSLTLAGQPATNAAVFPIELRSVTAGYFRALGIPLLRGRPFVVRENADSLREILINETLARRYFQGADPVGVETNRGTIVGVVGDVRQVSLDQPASPEIYMPVTGDLMQLPELGITLVVSTRGHPERVVDAVRAVIREVDPTLAVFNVKTMDRVMSDSLADFRLYLSVIAALAGLSLVLAVTGTYGVISYIVETRSRDFAIRVALGADMARITRIVLTHGLVLGAVGFVLGLGGIFAISPVLGSLPVNVRPPDLHSTAPVALLLGIVVALACLLPGRRAARMDPAAVLRRD